MREMIGGNFSSGVGAPVRLRTVFAEFCWRNSLTRVQFSNCKCDVTELSLAFSVMILSGDCSYIQSSAYLGNFQTLQQISLSDGGCKNMPFVCRYMSVVIPISPLRCFGSLLVPSFGPLLR